MDSIQAIAQAINAGMTSGQVIGRGKKNYTLWNFTVQGYRIYYKFVKMLSSSLEVVTASYPGVHIFEGLESDWHTQARLTGSINDMRHQLHNEESEQKGVMPFGKYKGMKVNEITDRSYICWLASQTMDKEEDPNAIEHGSRGSHSAELYVPEEERLTFDGMCLNHTVHGKYRNFFFSIGTHFGVQYHYVSYSSRNYDKLTPQEIRWNR